MIVYTSRTGNVRHIINKLNLPNCEITKDLLVNEPYFLFTYTDKLGEVPPLVEDFLEVNDHLLKGIIASGNINFGDLYCKSADIISEKHNVPIIRKIDLRGTNEDIESIQNQYNKYMR